MSALAVLRKELMDDLGQLRSEYRKNAEPALEVPRLDWSTLRFRLLLGLPAIKALVIVLAVDVA